MKVEQLMRKYKYGYSHAKYLLEEPFVKDLLQYQQELAMKVYKYKREVLWIIYESKEKRFTIWLKHDITMKKIV